jgi:hypothetical protein
MVLHLATLVPHALVAETQTGGAPVYGFGKLTVMEDVFCPEVMVVPPGVVQAYPVAPVTAGIEYTTPVAPGQMLEGPEVNAPGTIGFLEIVIHLGALVDEPPHDKDAATHNCPDVKAAGKVTCTFSVPCPDVTGADDPDNVQL